MVRNVSEIARNLHIPLVIPVVVAGAIAIDSKFHGAHSISETNEMPPILVQAIPESPVFIQEGISIVPGSIDIKPGANVRTSPYIGKETFNMASVPPKYRGKVIRVYNPEVVWGTKADPLTTTSGDRLHPKQDPWFAFELDGQRVYVNAGPATSEVVETSLAREPITVRKIHSGKVVYYEGPNGYGYTLTYAEIAPPVTRDTPKSLQKPPLST